MIFEGIINAVAGIVSFIAGLMPEFDTPAWLTTIAAKIDLVVANMAPLGVWLPFGAAGTAVTLVLAAVAVAVIIKLVRIIASFLTLGGGAAG